MTETFWLQEHEEALRQRGGKWPLLTAPQAWGLEELTERAPAPARPQAIGNSVTKLAWDKQRISEGPYLPCSPAGQQGLPGLTVFLICE